jgi:hypothetical protein
MNESRQVQLFGALALAQAGPKTVVRPCTGMPYPKQRMAFANGSPEALIFILDELANRAYSGPSLSPTSRAPACYPTLTG